LQRLSDRRSESSRGHGNRRANILPQQSGLEQCLADLNSSVGDETFDPGGSVDGSGPFDRVQLERPTQAPNEGKGWAVALQLPAAAGPVSAELRTPQALPGLRCRTPPRPDRGREREACTPYAGLRWSWQNLAAAMIEAPRRHGHFDPRWHANGLSPRDREDHRAPMIRTAGDAIRSWENEGGSYSMTDELDLEVNRSEQPPAGLDWYAFSTLYFPGRRRHDLEVLKAYEAYRSAAVAPSIPHRRRTIASVS
jgi:hypothetical protein